MKRLLAVILAAGLAGACAEETAKAKKEGLGKATADAANDTQVLGKAEAAANEVLRNPSDCEAVKAALPEANRLLGEADAKLQTPAGRAILGALQNTRYIDFKRVVASPEELDHAILSGEALLAVEIPPGFERKLRRGERLRL